MLCCRFSYNIFFKGFKRSSLVIVCLLTKSLHPLDAGSVRDAVLTRANSNGPTQQHRLETPGVAVKYRIGAVECREQHREQAGAVAHSPALQQLHLCRPLAAAKQHHAGQEPLAWGDPAVALQELRAGLLVGRLQPPPPGGVIWSGLLQAAYL